MLVPIGKIYERRQRESDFLPGESTALICYLFSTFKARATFRANWIGFSTDSK